MAKKTRSTDRPGEAPWESLWVETSDHALLHVRAAGPLEDQSSPTVLLLHGWSMSGACFARQHPLSERFRIVCPDLRGHAESSKPLHGHTLPRYAQDVAEIADALGLERFLLAGWSLAGPLALECWKLLGPERMAALALVEMTPAPLSSEPWNTHGLRGGDLDGLAKALRKMQHDQRAHLEGFVRAMFANGQGTERECGAFLREALKCPAPVAAAIYSDYALRDYSALVPEVTIPALAAFGTSTHLCFGPVPAQYLAAAMPDCRAVLFQHSGHMPFYEEPAAFNQALEDLASRAGLAG